MYEIQNNSVFWGLGLVSFFEYFLKKYLMPQTFEQVLYIINIILIFV